MHSLTQHIKHLLKATNQYGVHSPFVYNYLTKCLYIKQKYKGSKSEIVLLKSIPFFKISKLKIDIQDSDLEKRIKKEFALEPNNKKAFDLLYCDYQNENTTFFKKENVHNNSMVIINNIHKNKNTSSNWNKLIKKEAITVSIDMFYCGVLFFRKEQMKEHFKIRI